MHHERIWLSSRNWQWCASLGARPLLAILSRTAAIMQSCDRLIGWLKESESLRSQAQASAEAVAEAWRACGRTKNKMLFSVARDCENFSLNGWMQKRPRCLLRGIGCYKFCQQNFHVLASFPDGSQASMTVRIKPVALRRRISHWATMCWMGLCVTLHCFSFYLGCNT